MPRPLASLKLRTRLLFSFVLLIVALTCATLLVVHRTAQIQAQEQVERAARSAILTFQVTQHQHELSLRHTADLLAAVALMRNDDATSIDEPTDDPWRSEDCDLFVLADASGKIIALRTTGANFPRPAAEQMLHASLKHHKTTGWWFDGGRLYQVVLAPIRDTGSPATLEGTVVVGRVIDNREADELRRISSTQVVFRYGSNILVSTFAPLEEQQLARQIKDRPASTRVQIANQQFFASTFNLTPAMQPAATLTVLESYRDAMAALNRLNHLLLALGLLAVVAGGALAFIISDTFTRPLGVLVEGVRALETGDFSYPLELRGGDEVAHVTRAFDRMRNTLQTNEAQREELESQLRHSQKMDAVGRLAGGVAHDFNNLLTIIKGHNSLLLEQMKSSDPLLGSSRQIEKAADRAVSLIRQLMAFCRKQVLQPKVLDVNVLVSEMGKLLTRLIPEDVNFSFRPDESLGPVKADPGQIEQVILNLVVNACDAMPNGGKLMIETHSVSFGNGTAPLHAAVPAGDYVMLSVRDTGHGMDTATKSRIFEPFFTTKPEGKGTGLGLATVYGVVKQSGGYITVESAPGEGARFEVYLPLASELPASDVREDPALVSARQNSKTVLIAEDEEAVRELAARFLQSAGYNVLSAKDGLEALEIAKDSKRKIHALLTDIGMPKIRGPELAREIRKIQPELKVLFMSGYVEYRNGDEIRDKNAFLQKPFSRDVLIAKVSEVLSDSQTPAKQPATVPAHIS